MNTFFIVCYLVSFCLLVGMGFALMYTNLKSIQEDMKRPRRHPEAPEPGEEVMYVDVSTVNAEEFQSTKDKLEQIFNDD